jgi:uncharacterized membrane protein YkoI
MKLFPTLVGVLAAGFIAAGAASADPPNKPHGPPSPPHRANSLGADWRQQQDEARQGVRQRRIMPLGAVIQQIRRRFPGRQLDAGLEYQGDRPIYRLRWMTPDGRRVDYIIDAATGQVLSGQ